MIRRSLAVFPFIVAALAAFAAASDAGHVTTAGSQAPIAPTITHGPVIELAPEGAHPAIARSRRGHGLVAWAVENAGLCVRRLRAGGGVGRVREVIEPSQGSLSDLEAGADATGNFVLAWSATDPAHTTADVLAQRLRPNGEAQGGPIRVSLRAEGLQSDPRLGVAPDGRFAVLYRNAADGTPSAVALRLARFTADGLRLGPPRALPIAARGTPLSGGVAAGSFVAAGWTDVRDCATSGEEIRARVARLPWSGGGTAAVTEFADGRVCDGGPVMVDILESDHGPLAIFAGHNYNLQRFDPASGAPVGRRTVFAEPLDCSAAFCETLAAAAGDSAGRFVAIWQRRERIDGEDRYTLSAQLFGREGRPRHLAPVAVTEAFSLRDPRPAAAFAAGGALEVVWEHAAASDGAAQILLRRLEFD